MLVDTMGFILMVVHMASIQKGRGTKLVVFENQGAVSSPGLFPVSRQTRQP
jgi:hypothetical protein